VSNSRGESRMMSQKGSVMKSIILGPEILWLAVYAATTFIAGRNSAPTFPLNNFLSSAYWLAPSAVAILVFWRALPLLRQSESAS
jgi:hypothetical protein